jgi:acyl-CoA reductase-like NAD-dependent aldehyde dehydrogenase
MGSPSTPHESPPLGIVQHPAELKARAKAAKLRARAAKARVKAHDLRERAAKLEQRADAWERRADELDGVARADVHAAPPAG